MKTKSKGLALLKKVSLILLALILSAGLFSLWYQWPRFTPGIRDRVVNANAHKESSNSSSTPTNTQSPTATAIASIDLPTSTGQKPRGVNKGATPVTISVDVHFPTAPPKENGIEEIGQAGDSFGSFNALLSAIAGLVLILAAVFQFIQLRIAKDEQIEEVKSRDRQQFEATFFQLLGYTRTIEERFVRNYPKSNFVKALRRQLFVSRFKQKPNAYRLADIQNVKQEKEPKSGTDALDSYAYTLARKCLPLANVSPEENMARLVSTFHSTVYTAHPSWFGPYYRVLYQTFKHIKNSKLKGDEKIEFANIARGQISEAAVFLLSANAWGPWGYKFVVLIEEYGLLEHMHPRFRDEYATVFKAAYSAKAFMGSEQREVWMKGQGKAWTIPPEGTFFKTSSTLDEETEDYED